MWRRGSLAAVARAAKSMPSVDADFCGWHARGGHFRKEDALGAFIFRFYRNRAECISCPVGISEPNLHTAMPGKTDAATTTPTKPHVIRCLFCGDEMPDQLTCDLHWHYWHSKL